ncbi:MAG: GNAT family N-acetyltransferase [Rhabdochlamydiaceae bacterium]|nr:GNAT family N-acetyltransferase [Rhabdochlamydiaceae bacterium]
MSEEPFDIRYTRILDISYLRRWIQDPKVLRWFSMSTPEEIEQALAVWMSFARYNASLTAVIDREPCGVATLFLPYYKKTIHHCLFKICVAPEYQGRGIGSALIKNIKHLAKTQFNMEAIYAESFDGNPLIPLLKKFDFHEFVKQDNYVKTETGYLARVLLEAVLQEGPSL